MITENFTHTENEQQIINTQLFLRAPAFTNVRETLLSALRNFLSLKDIYFTSCSKTSALKYFRIMC